MRISVAICTYDRYELLGEALRSLAEQTVGPDAFEIIVVDNTPSAERSAAEQARLAGIARLRWVHERTPGLSNARNVAMGLARAPVIAYLDDDAIALPNWLEELDRAWRAAGPDVGTIGGRVRPRWVSERPEWLSDDLLGYLSVVDLGGETRPLGPGEWLAGANISYRIEALRSAGGFSVALGRVGSGISLMSNDETELADRLSAQGWTATYAGRAEVLHLVDPSRTTQAWFRRRVAWQAVSEYVRAPEAVRGGADAAWREVKRYFAHLHPADRTVRALALPQKTPEELRWQMSAIYNTIVCLLSAVEDPDAC